MQLYSTWGNDIALAQGESDILTFVFLSNWNKVKIFKLSWRETFQFRKANFSSQHMRLTSTGNRWNASLSFNVTHWVKLTPQRRHHFGSLFLPWSLWTQLFGRAPSPTMCSIFCFPFFVAPNGLSSDNRTVLPIWFKIFCDFVYIIMGRSTGFFPNSDHPGSSATTAAISLKNQYSSTRGIQRFEQRHLQLQGHKASVWPPAATPTGYVSPLNPVFHLPASHGYAG